MAAPPDPEQVQVLRHDTHALSARLDALAVQLLDGSLIPADLSAEYNGQLRHEALALAFAMVGYLARNDPRVIVLGYKVAPVEGPLLQRRCKVTTLILPQFNFEPFPAFLANSILPFR